MLESVTSAPSFQLEETLGVSGSHCGSTIDISTSVQWDCSTAAPLLNGSDARLSHRCPGGAEKGGVGGREDLLLKFDVAIVVEVGCCGRLDRRGLATQVTSFSENLSCTAQKVYRLIQTASPIFSGHLGPIMRGFEGKARTSAPFE